jgi:hypothetical protein
MAKARILIIKSGGGVSCDHAMRACHQEEDITVLCENCSDELLAGFEVAGTIKASDKRLEYVCPHVFQLIQLPFEESGAKWVQKGNTLLCGDCAKKEPKLCSEFGRTGSPDK